MTTPTINIDEDQIDAIVNDDYQEDDITITKTNIRSGVPGVILSPQDYHIAGPSLHKHGAGYSGGLS